MRASRRVNEQLDAIAFRKARSCDAAVFDGVKEYLCQPGYRRDAPVRIFCIERIVGRDTDKRRITLAVPKLETAHVVRARVVQHQCPILTEKFDAMPQTEIRRTAHGQSHERACSKLQSHGHCRLEVLVVGQPGYASR